MLKADNTQKRCFVACDEQTKKDGRCICLSNTHQSLQLLQTDVISSFFMDKPTAYEKNNLPIEVRQKYCEIIEKYQLIAHYENGIITKEELIEKL